MLKPSSATWETLGLVKVWETGTRGKKNNNVETSPTPHRAITAWPETAKWNWCSTCCTIAVQLLTCTVEELQVSSHCSTILKPNKPSKTQPNEKNSQNPCPNSQKLWSGCKTFCTEVMEQSAIRCNEKHNLLQTSTKQGDSKVMADHLVAITCLKFNVTLLIQVLEIHFHCFYFLCKFFRLNASRSMIS